MINYQSQRFVDINQDQQQKLDDKNFIVKKKNKIINGFNSQQAFLSENSLQKFKQEQSTLQQQEQQKDRKIKKLTTINKQLIDTLKTHNQQLSERLKNQRMKIPKIAKNAQKSQSQSSGNQKKFQSLKKQLQNAYRQIDVYKHTILNSKSKQASLQNVGKVKQMQSRLKIQDSNIQKYHQQIKVLQKIKEQQQKQLNTISNDQFKYNQKKQQRQIIELKQRLKVTKKNIVKRQQLQKKQHLYLVELQGVYRKFIKEENNHQTEIDITANSKMQISQMEWKQVKAKLIDMKKIYEQNGKKILYINHIKSKQQKNLQENELKIKQKERQLKKLQSKYSQVIKLSKIRKSQKTVHNLNMTKIEDLISRQNNNSIQINEHLQKLKNLGLKQQQQKQQSQQKQKQKERRSAKKWLIQQDSTTRQNQLPIKKVLVQASKIKQKQQISIKQASSLKNTSQSAKQVKDISRKLMSLQKKLN